LKLYSRGGQTFFLTGQISLKCFIAGRKKFFALFFLHKYHIIDVSFGYFIHKCIINSLDVHPKFDTGAAENLWRAELWPPLLYSIASYGIDGKPSENLGFYTFQMFIFQNIIFRTTVTVCPSFKGETHFMAKAKLKLFCDFFGNKMSHNLGLKQALTGSSLLCKNNHLL